MHSEWLCRHVDHRSDRTHWSRLTCWASGYDLWGTSMQAVKLSCCEVQQTTINCCRGSPVFMVAMPAFYVECCGNWGQSLMSERVGCCQIHGWSLRIFKEEEEGVIYYLLVDEIVLWSVWDLLHEQYQGNSCESVSPAIYLSVMLSCWPGCILPLDAVSDLPHYLVTWPAET